MKYRIPALDGLRGIAAWLVVLSHTNNALATRYSFISGAGQTGVMLFFSLSGFLMGYLYFNRSINDIGQYSIARTARIFPLYFIIIIYSLLSKEGYIDILFHAYNVTFSNLFDHLLFIKGQNILWTIPVDVSFYIAFIFLWLIRSKNIPAYLSTVLILFFLPIIFDYSPLPTGHQIPKYIAFFLVGIVISEAYLKNSTMFNPVWSFISLVAVIVGIFLLIPGNYRMLFNRGIGGYQAFLPLFICGTILVSTCYSSLCQYILGCKFLTFQGRISYSLYLLHPIIIHTTRKITGANDWLLFVYILPLSFLVSTLSFKLIEKPADIFIRNIFQKIEKVFRKLYIKKLC